MLSLLPFMRILFVHADHDGGRLYDGISLSADLEPEFPDGVHGDGGAHDVAAADVDFDDAVDGTFLYINDLALELISCAEFHNLLSFLAPQQGELSAVRLTEG